MIRGRDDAETCRLNGWVVGTRLVGDEGYGPTVIKITAIGWHVLLAFAVSHNGKAMKSRESTWTLECREWTQVES